MTKKGAATASSPSDSTENASGTARFVCSMCAKVYRSGAGLRYHKRKRHRGMVEPTTLHRVKCQEPGCAFQMLAISDLRNHLANLHQKPEYKCTEEKKFRSVADFTDWKSSFESSTGSKYVKNCGAKGKSDNQTTEYYYCNRTGSSGQGLRRNKAQGTSRCGIYCTSSMKVDIQNDEQITVQYYPAHYGHSYTPATEESHLSENSMTATRMDSGISSTAMINHYHPCNSQDNNSQNPVNHYSSSTADCSSSLSPGSASSSSPGGSNSNSNLPIVSSCERSFATSSDTSLKSNINAFNQNPLSHCIIISPSVMVEESSSLHSNHYSTPVFVVQQQSVNHSLPPSNSSMPTAIVTSTTDLPTKPKKCVSDIMRETFQLLAYWPLDHHNGAAVPENEPQIRHPYVNMEEHLMF